MNIKRKISHFEFSSNDLEISFTYFYFLGHQISIDKGAGEQSRKTLVNSANVINDQTSETKQPRQINQLDQEASIEQQSDSFMRSIDQSFPRLDFEKSVFTQSNRWSLAEAHELRSDFINEVLIDYFYLDIEKPGVKEIFDKDKDGNKLGSEYVIFENEKGGYSDRPNIKGDLRTFKFKIGCRTFTDGGSAHAIECFLMKNGHLAVTLKFVNTSNIPAYDALALIRQPDLIKVDPCPEHVGFLVKKSDAVIEIIELYLHQLLVEENNVEKIESGDCHGIKRIPISFAGEGDLYEDGKRSIPYVGTIFSLNALDHNDIESLETSIERFTIAAARATPPFLNSFENPSDYLKSENRNVYIPGESIVYIAKRGWCVFDAGMQDSKIFYKNVIETTRLSLLFTYSTQRTWYRYYRFLKDIGKIIIGKLNRSVIDLIKKNSEDNWFVRILKKTIYDPALAKCDEEIANVTGFIAKARLIAPSGRTSRLFEAHMMSHTARAAVRRCEYICHLLEVEAAALQTTKHFSDSLNIAANHYRSIARQISQIRLIVSIIILIATFGWEKIVGWTNSLFS